MESKFVYKGKEVLDIMSKYAVNRNKSIERLIVKYFKLDQNREHKKILEFGAGTGEFINRFKKYPYLSTYAIELDGVYFSELSRSHVTYQSLDELNEHIDFIFTIDVLEHVKDDEKILKSFHTKLNQRGLLFIYVPARPELFSKFDERIGHFRRYRLKELRDQVKKAGFTICVAHYDDFLGYFASVYNKLTTDGTLNYNVVKWYDKIFVPVSRRLESVITPPIGKNILLVAEKA